MKEEDERAAASSEGVARAVGRRVDSVGVAGVAGRQGAGRLESVELAVPVVSSC